MVGRSQLNVAPLLGVLMVVFVGFSSVLRYETIQIPRTLTDPRECIVDGPPKVVLQLHADDSIDFPERLVEAPQVAATLAEVTRDDLPATYHAVFYVQADDGVRWGDF